MKKNVLPLILSVLLLSMPNTADAGFLKKKQNISATGHTTANYLQQQTAVTEENNGATALRNASASSYMPGQRNNWREGRKALFFAVFSIFPVLGLVPAAIAIYHAIRAMGKGMQQKGYAIAALALVALTTLLTVAILTA